MVESVNLVVLLSQLRIAIVIFVRMSLHDRRSSQRPHNRHIRQSVISAYLIRVLRLIGRERWHYIKLQRMLRKRTESHAIKRSAERAHDGIGRRHAIHFMQLT